MPFDFFDEKDDFGIRCSNCGEILFRQFVGMYGLAKGIILTEETVEKIESHLISCKKKSERKP